MNLKQLIYSAIIPLVSSVGIQAQDQPNIVFVFIDDMGYGDLGCYGNADAKTPNIDRLAEEGLRFSQFYVNAPVCSPSRVAVTTGQYPPKWEITSFINNRNHNRQRGMVDYLSLDAPSLARNLQAAGYYTAHIGKWHLGGGRDVGDAPFITEYGFDESVTQFEGLGERYLATYETLDLYPDSTRGLEKTSAALGKGPIHWIKRYDVTQVFVDRSMQAIENAKSAEKPFYLNLWLDDMHTPIEPPPHLRGDGSNHERYMGVLYEMDRQLGRLFDYIKADPDLQKNTMIILTSDNGRARNYGSSGIYRGFKGHLYEGGIRMPMIVWCPEAMPDNVKGQFNTVSVVAGMDLPPSLIKIGGAKKDRGVSFDGMDMSKVLLGQRQTIRRQPVMWLRPPQFTPDFPDLAIREGDYKLLMNVDGSGIELYNLAVDESETTNIANENPRIVSRLRKKLEKWYAEMPPLVENR